MNYAEQTLNTSSPAVNRYWRGLGAWNIYFIFKLALYWQGVIDFNALTNLAFAAFLLVPLPPLWLHRTRHVLAIPIGIALFYQDSWLPPFSRLLAQSSQVSAFSLDYLIELASRFINWDWMAVLFVLAVGYAFIAGWIRVTVPVVLGLIWVAMLPVLSMIGATSFLPTTATATTAPAGNATNGVAAVEQNTAPAPAPAATPKDPELDAKLKDFYASESERQVSFSASPAQPFDVLVVNVCSLSWDDMEEAGVTNHPLFDYLDVSSTTSIRQLPIAALPACGYCVPAAARFPTKNSTAKPRSSVICSRTWPVRVSRRSWRSITTGYSMIISSRFVSREASKCRCCLKTVSSLR